jgi:AraC family transcriptional regulator
VRYVVVPDSHCYGDVRRVRHVGQLTLVETEHSTSASAPIHSHLNSSFCLVLDGGFVECAGGTHRYGTAGAVLFQPWKEAHSRQFQAGVNRCFVVDVGAALSASLERRGLAGAAARIVTQQRASWLATRLYEEFCREDAESALAIEGLTSAVLAQLIRVAEREAYDEPTPAWLPAVLDLVDRRYRAPVRLAKLAEHAGVHPRFLSRVFRRCVGVTLTDYVRRRRIDWAGERLVTTDLPLSRIAMEAGFTDQAHFARLFKRVTGLTPRAFRARSEVEGPRS